MKKNLAIGTSDFKTLRQKGLYFIDKSMIIKELIEDSSLITLIPRPRRFGKTLNMSMLYYFFDRNNAAENRKLFEGLKIENEELFDREQGMYPVIYITFKSIKEATYEEAYGHVKYIIAKLFSDMEVFVDFNKVSNYDKRNYQAVIDCNSSPSVLNDSLKLLTEVLCKSTDNKPLILIDEYDTPIHQGKRI